MLRLSKHSEPFFSRTANLWRNLTRQGAGAPHVRVMGCAVIEPDRQHDFLDLGMIESLSATVQKNNPIEFDVDRNNFSDARKIRHVLWKVDWTAHKHKRPEVHAILAR